MKDYDQDCKEFEMEGIKYFRLRMRCPVCVERDCPTIEGFWHHAKCGGDIYLGDNATFYCSKCKESIPWIMAKFECPYHNSTASVGYFISKSVDASIVMNPLLLGEPNYRDADAISFMRKLASSYDDQIDEFVRRDKLI